MAGRGAIGAQIVHEFRQTAGAGKHFQFFFDLRHAFTLFTLSGFLLLPFFPLLFLETFF